MAWVKTQSGDLADIRRFHPDFKEGKAKITDERGKVLASYLSKERVQEVHEDVERWLDGIVKSQYAGRKRVYHFPPE